MFTKLFFPAVAGVRIDRVWWEGQALHLAAATTKCAARCPLCGRRSRRVHSSYRRTIADLPCAGARLVVHLQARRFACRVRWCRRQIFTERLPALVAPWGRRTVRLQEQLQRTGFDLGGAPGAWHARAAGMPVSGRTLLRLVRAAPTPAAGPVGALGVDDWAQRRGRTYGTILVNLETQDVIDLLPDRTAQTLAVWLRQHPEIAIISRDRGGAYAEGARQGAPQAVQVADRFHLVRNVTDSLERFLRRHHARLRQAAQAPEAATGTAQEERVDPARGAPQRPPTRKEQEHQERRACRVARYEEVQALQTQGYSLRAAARQSGLNRRTVQRYAQAEGFPERQPQTRCRPQLGRYVPYLRERWAAGCRNARQLWYELREQGFTGGYTTVSDCLRTWRPPTGPGACRRRHGRQPAPPATTTYTPRQTVWLLLRPITDLTADEQGYLTRLYQLWPQVYLAQARAFPKS